jgi:hypothetical protein
MKEFRYCAHCSKNIRLSKDVGLSVYVGAINQDFLCELVLIIPESSPNVVVLHKWLYHVSFKEKMFQWELETKELEAEDEAVMEEIDRIRRGEEWRL